MSDSEKVLCPYCGAEMRLALNEDDLYCYVCSNMRCGSTSPSSGISDEALDAALKRYKPTRAERKAAMKLEAGEHPMSYKRVVEILRNEYECASRDGCDRACCASCDLVMNQTDVLTALFLAIHAIRNDILHEYEGADTDYDD